MSEMQDALNKILSNPEAMKQVKSLGEQLGLNADPPPPKSAEPASAGIPNLQGIQNLQGLQSLAPLMNMAQPDGEVAALLNALKPFLSGEKLSRLNRAQKLLGFIKLIPLLKDSGMFL